MCVFITALPITKLFAWGEVKQLNFIIGIQGTIVEHRWRWNLTTLGIERRRQDRIIRKCMTASVEGMQRVLRAETRGGDG